MSYAAVPDMRMPYDNDGTVVAVGGTVTGILSYPSGAQNIAMNAPTGIDSNAVSTGGTGLNPACVWLFFPEQREVTAYWMQMKRGSAGFGTENKLSLIQGSNDTTNGLDGTWETASISGIPSPNDDYDWRSNIKTISFTGPKKVVRFVSDGTNPGDPRHVTLLHVYGEKAAGETAHDLIFIDHDTTPGVEYAAVEDFGDRPLGTTVVRQFRLKNTSGTRTATNVNLQCNDPDFAISTDGVTWVVTINIASLAPGAQSSTMYIRNTTPSPGNLLGPDFARIVVIAEDGSGGNFFAP